MTTLDDLLIELDHDLVVLHYDVQAMDHFRPELIRIALERVEHAQRCLREFLTMFCYAEMMCAGRIDTKAHVHQWWVILRQQHSGDFLQTLAEAALRADAENFDLLLPSLQQIYLKYPEYHLLRAEESDVR